MVSRWAVGVALAAWPLPSQAHSPVPGIEGFYTGMLHPFTSAPQILLLLGLGLLAGGLETWQARWPIGIFPGAMAAGVAIGGAAERLDAPMLAAALAASLLSAIAAGPRFPAAVALAAAGGVCMGVVSLAEPGELRDRIITTLGALIGANVALLCLFGLAAVIRERYPFAWVEIALRIAAAWVAAVAVLMLALELAPAQSPP